MSYRTNAFVIKTEIQKSIRWYQRWRQTWRAKFSIFQIFDMIGIATLIIIGCFLVWEFGYICGNFFFNGKP